MPNKFRFVLGCYFAVLLLYAVWSYGLTAPNLILTSWSPYLSFQNFMWETFFNNRQLLTWSYTAMMTLLFVMYFLITKWVSPTNQKANILILVGVLIMPLLLSNNALSYDVFNYIFNAKMVSVYQANPHVQVALNFADDPWIRFMHNVHTPAPYGYGWTVLSLVPFSLGLGKFLPTWLSFRLFSALSLILLYTSYQWMRKKQNVPISNSSLLFVFLNPLLLIEVVSNSHNDLWMMLPALIPLGLVFKPNKNKPQNYLISFLLLLGSISIKFASVVLIPIWIWLALQPIMKAWPKFIANVNQLLLPYWPLLSSLLMFIPLLTSRSQQFHPWYLTWVLTWLPLFQAGKIKWLNRIQNVWFWAVITLSASSMFRYLPYLWHGEHSPEILWQQKMITWVPFLVGVVLSSLFRKERDTIDQ